MHFLTKGLTAVLCVCCSILSELILETSVRLSKSEWKDSSFAKSIKWDFSWSLEEDLPLGVGKSYKAWPHENHELL